MVRTFLFVQAALFLAFGVHSLINAPTLAENLGAVEISSSGLHELRSNYGGISLAIGTLCVWGGCRLDKARPALFLLVFYTGGYVFGRLLALPFDGLPETRFVIFGAYELLTAVGAAWLLTRLDRRDDSSNERVLD